jgi:glycosyltransferase involved in cell wall biosynthesis
MHSTKKPIKLSLVIPIFNEEKRIHNLNTLWDYIKNKKYIKELIVVNDGSTDKTKIYISEYQKKTRCKVISYRKNKGKGRRSIYPSENDWESEKFFEGKRHSGWNQKK